MSTITGKLMTIDNFENELISDKIQIYLAPFLQVLISCLAFVFVKLLTYNYIHNIILTLITGVICAIIGILAYKLSYIAKHHPSNVEVDCDNFLFKISEKEYCFSDLLPEYEVKQDIKEIYILNLYFKNGTNEKIFLTKNVALAFMNNYINKYAIPRYSDN